MTPITAPIYLYLSETSTKYFPYSSLDFKEKENKIYLLGYTQGDLVLKFLYYWTTKYYTNITWVEFLVTELRSINQINSQESN